MGNPELSWTVHPLRRNWMASIGVVAFLIFLCVLIHSIYGPFLAIVSFVVLFLSLSSFFFPTKYRFYPDRLEVRTLTRKYTRSWNYFKSFHVSDKGVLLSPFEGRSRLERFRGIFLMFEEDVRDAVLEYLRRKIGGAEGDQGRFEEDRRA